MSNRFLIHEVAKLAPSILKFTHAADFALAKHFKENHQLGARDRSYISDAIYAIIRNKGFLEWLIGGAQKPTSASAPWQLACLANALKTLELQGTDTAAIPDAALAAQVLACCESHTLPLANGGATAAEEDGQWLSAMKAALAASPTLPESARHNLPQWLAEKLQAQYGQAAFWELIAALRQAAPLDLRINPLKTKRPAVLAALETEGLAAQPTALSPWGIRMQGKPSLHKLSTYQEGLIEVQDEGSQLLCLITDAKRNETVVDFCAGAGGKTLALGALMRNTGRLYAFDNSASRLEALKPRLQRSGLSNVHTMVIENEQDARLQRMWGKADRVLVDSPCSGLGTLRRNPDIAWRLKPKELDALQTLQKNILASAAKLLKVGGTLVYATCSLLDEENTAVAQWWQTQNREWQPVPLQAALKKHDIALTAESPEANHLALLPHTDATDGFFCAAWIKK